MRRPRLCRTLTALWIAASPALAQQEAQDREDLDRAAGRVVFQNTPIAQAGPFPSTPPASALPPANERERRPVRVILPSPYGR